MRGCEVRKESRYDDYPENEKEFLIHAVSYVVWWFRLRARGSERPLVFLRALFLQAPRTGSFELVDEPDRVSILESVNLRVSLVYAPCRYSPADQAGEELPSPC